MDSLLEKLQVRKWTFRCGCGGTPMFGQTFDALPELVSDLGDGFVLWGRCPYRAPNGTPLGAGEGGQPHSMWLPLGDAIEATS